MMTVNFNDVWTQERVERLTALWAAGKSAKVIAYELGGFADCRDGGCNAIIGKIHRLKLPDPVGKKLQPRGAERRSKNNPLAGPPRVVPTETPRPFLAPPPAPRLRNGHDPSQRRNPSHNIVAAIAIAGSEPGLPEKLEEPATGNGLQLIELTNSTCRYPFGHPGIGRFYFCGADGADMKQQRPYCQFHHMKAFTPATQDRRSASHGR